MALANMVKKEKRMEDVVRVTPPVDVYESMDEVLIVADLPGTDPSTLDVRIDPPELRIEARQPAAREKPGPDGWAPVLFERAFRIPETIDADATSAELKNGVLHVRLKKSEASKPRRIQVKS